MICLIVQLVHVYIFFKIQCLYRCVIILLKYHLHIYQTCKNQKSKSKVIKSLQSVLNQQIPITFNPCRRLDKPNTIAQLCFTHTQNLDNPPKWVPQVMFSHHPFPLFTNGIVGVCFLCVVICSLPDVGVCIYLYWNQNFFFLPFWESPFSKWLRW